MKFIVIACLCLLTIILAPALFAQDTELTPEQQAAKCAAEGGCATFTRDAFMAVLRAQFLRGLEAGVQSCTKPA